MNQTISGFNILTLTEESSHSKAILCPERGGILIQLTLQDKDILYLQEETFADVSKNIRGGNPVLFPICGPLPNDAYSMNGQTYSMKQHGFARNKAWEVIESTSTKVTLQLTDDEETRAQYPFQFRLRFTYELKDGKLLIDQTYENLSANVMPFYAGFHPYFIGNHSNSEYSIPATHYLDYSDYKTKERTCNISELDIRDTKLFVHMSDSTSSIKGDSYKLQMHTSNPFNCAVLWSERPTEYICLEPWMAGPYGFDNKEGVVRLEAGEKLHAQCGFSIVID